MNFDKIQLRGMSFYGFHGATKSEKEIGQQFIVDIEIELSLRQAGTSDNLEDTVNYSELYDLVENIIKGPSKNLLENVAETIASAILTQFEIHSVRVKIKKPEVPIKNSVLKYASVEIYRLK